MPEFKKGSEFITKLGTDNDAPDMLAKARVASLDPDETLGLDAKCFDSVSEKISITEVGKKKDDTFGVKLSFFMQAVSKVAKSSDTVSMLAISQMSRPSLDSFPP